MPRGVPPAVAGLNAGWLNAFSISPRNSNVTLPDDANPLLDAEVEADQHRGR